jgi:hypothetical protein
VFVLKGDDVGHEDIVTDVKGILSDLVPRAAVSALAVVAGLILCACSGTADDVAPSSVASSAAAAPTLVGDVAFPRTLQAQRWVEVDLSGAQDDNWVVTSAALDVTTFTSLAATKSNLRLFEGYVARLRVPLGVANCPAGAGASLVKLTVANGAGAVANLEVELPTDVLEGINAGECATRKVLDVASPALGGAEAASGTTVDTTLTISRGAAGAGASVVVTAMRGSVIFDMEPRAGTTLPLTLGPDESAITVPVTFTASRCDPHAFAESKKTFVFSVWVTIDGGSEKYLEIGPDAALQVSLQSAFDRCGQVRDATTPGGA